MYFELLSVETNQNNCNSLPLFLVFSEDRQVLTMMHLFGIGQGYKPYPTNDASACWKQHLYITPFRQFFCQLEDRSIFPFCQNCEFWMETAIFPIFKNHFLRDMIPFLVTYSSLNSLTRSLMVLSAIPKYSDKTVATHVPSLFLLISNA